MKEIKEQTFEDYLKDRHIEVFHGIADDCPDDFELWLSNLGADDFIHLAQEYTKQQLSLKK